METNIQAHYREIAFSLLNKTKSFKKGVAIVALWRDNTHFENWLNNVDLENNKTIKLVKQDLPTEDVIVILATSNKPDQSDLNIIYDMKAE